MTLNEKKKIIRLLEQQSKILREMADRLDKTIIIIENNEDDKMLGEYLIKMMELDTMKLKKEIEKVEM